MYMRSLYIMEKVRMSWKYKQTCKFSDLGHTLF